MRDQPQSPESKRSRLQVGTIGGRALIGVAAGLVVALCAGFAFAAAGSGWFDAAVIGTLGGLPVFLSVMRWQAAADFCLGLLEAVVIVLGALAAVLGALAG